MLDATTYHSSHFRRKKSGLAKMPSHPNASWTLSPHHAVGCLRATCWSRHPECVTHKHMTVLLVPCGFASWNSPFRVLSRQTDGDQFQFWEEAKPHLANNCLHTPTLWAGDPSPTQGTGTSSNMEMPAHEGPWQTPYQQTRHLTGNLRKTRELTVTWRQFWKQLTCLTIQTSGDSIIGTCQILWKKKDVPLCHLFSPPLSQCLKNPVFPSLILSLGVSCFKKKRPE